jgi:hypothetical protein
MLYLTRWPLHTRNWQIFTMTFWNTQLWTSASFLTTRKISREESFQPLRKPH